MKTKRFVKDRKIRSIPLSIFILTSTYIISGCSLESPAYSDYIDENNEIIKCENVTEIVIEDQSITADNPIYNNKDFSPAFQFGMCPSSAPECITSEKGTSTCTTKSCANICYGKCVASFDAIHIKNCNDKENQIIACVDNWSDCDGEVMNGCEYNLSPNNALGCTYDRETQTSELVCEDGWADCNGEIQDGCEYDLVTNNALSCVNKQVTCLDNSVFSDCDGNYKNGCEYDIVSHNAVACHNKTVSCKNNYGDCNNYYLDGCEVDLLSNLSNCGACTLYTGEGDNKVVTENHACESGKVCNGFGECTDSCAAGSVFCGTSCVNTATNHIDASGVGCEDITDDEGNAYTKIYCVSNYTNCDDNPENGCEFILSSANAESCEHKTVVCQNGWGNCDGDYLNGCEYNLANNHALTCTWSESDVSLECMNDYAHFTDDYNDGCEFQLSRFNARSYTMTVDDDGTKHITFECISDFADCDGDYTNGCEYPLSSNNAKKCERKTNETSGEIEAVLTCSPNMADCDGNYLNGCEYNMKLSNVTSCKYNADFCEADGVDCNDETGDAITKRGIITCVSSFADMDKDYQNGCEIDGSTNLEHCGAKGEANDDDPESENYKGTACPSGNLCDGGKCGVSCTDPLKNCGGFCLDFEANNIATCDQSVSKLSAANCAEGWADGDGLLRNGCEYNLDAHHAEACQDKVLTCKEGYEDCNSNYLDGCEVDVLGTDPNHCGICGRVCSDIANVSVGTCYAGECKAVECDPNHHISSTDPTACVANTATKCAATHVADNNATDCTTANHAADGSCEAGGICKITKCQTGYHLSNTAAGNICVPNSLTACAPTTSAVTKDCLATDHLVAGTCNNGTCSATKCAVGYYLNGTTCKLNAADKCSADGSATTINCNTANNAAAGTCESTGMCKIKKCKTGYHLSSTAAGNVCVPNSLSACAAVNSATTKDCTITDHLVAGECNNGTCEATQCAVGYNLNGTTCVASSATACSPDGISSPVNCNTANNAAAGTCESTGMCKITKCKTGYHLSSTAAGNVCVENSLTACAKVDSATTIDCTTTANLVAGACNNGTCSATKCAVGYYLDGTTCKLNTALLCSPDGSSTTINCNTANHAAAGTCSASGTCTATKCQAGYYLVDGACVACPAGTYKSASDGKGLSSCIPCAAGTYSKTTARKEACIACAKGTYANISGSTSCIKCPPNTYSSSIGATECLSCGASQYAYSGASECTTDIVYECNSKNYAAVRFNGTTIQAYCIKSDSDMRDFDSANQSSDTWPEDNKDHAYILMTDIVLKTEPGWLNVSDWKGIAGETFSGIFIGNNHTISGTLTCASNCALFNELKNAKIDSLNLDLNITAKSGSASALAVSASNSTITNIHSRGNIISQSDSAAGIVARFYSSYMKDSSFTGTVRGKDYIGGIVGVSTGYIMNCFASAGITGTSKVGGIVGEEGPGIIMQSHFTGEVQGDSDVGGIVGSASYSNGKDVISSYVTDATITGKSNVGGIVGRTHYATIISSFFSGEVYGEDNVGGVVGLDDAGDTHIKQCGVFGIISGLSYGGYSLGGIIGNVSASTNLTTIKSSFNTADLKNAGSASQIAYLANGRLQINDAYAIGGFQNIMTYKSDDVYAPGGNASAAVCASWNRTGTHNSVNTGAITIGDQNVLLHNGTTLTNWLNSYSDYAYSDAERWEDRTCLMTAGPAKGQPTEFVIPIPKALPAIPFCR